MSGRRARAKAMVVIDFFYTVLVVAEVLDLVRRERVYLDDLRHAGARAVAKQFKRGWSAPPQDPR